jgi:hypothetical protein
MVDKTNHPDALPDGTLAKSTVKRLGILAPADKGEWVLTMRSGVSEMNDNVIGTFADYKTAFFIGGLLKDADANECPEYRTFDVIAAAPRQDVARQEGVNYTQADINAEYTRGRNDGWDSALASAVCKNERDRAVQRAETAEREQDALRDLLAGAERVKMMRQTFYPSHAEVLRGEDPWPGFEESEVIVLTAEQVDAALAADAQREVGE